MIRRLLCRGFPLFSLLLGITACEDEKPRPIDYWLSHPGERAAKIAECRDNPDVLMETPDCINVHIGEDAARQIERAARQAEEQTRQVQEAARRVREAQWQGPPLEGLLDRPGRCRDGTITGDDCVQTTANAMTATGRQRQREKAEDEEKRWKEKEEKEKMIEWYSSHPEERDARFIDCSKNGFSQKECWYAREGLIREKQQTEQQAIEWFRSHPLERATALVGCEHKVSRECFYAHQGAVRAAFDATHAGERVNEP